MYGVILIILIILLVGVLIWFLYEYGKYSLYRIIDAEFDSFCKTAVPVVYRESVYRPEINGRYEKSLAIALFDIALNTTKSNCDFLLPIINPPGFEDQLRVEGIDPISNKSHMFGYLFWNFNTEELIISFTGTLTISTVLLDMYYSQVPALNLNGYQDGVMCHSGFYNIYMAIRSILWTWWDHNKHRIKTIYITGYSLGGALSTLCAFDFAEEQPIHYSFGAPRSGNIQYADLFDQRVPTSLRINNTEDFIPQLPLASMGTLDRVFIYKHTGGNVPFTYSGSLSANHLDAYIDFLPN
jgi:triacylglycerol lipase